MKQHVFCRSFGTNDYSERGTTHEAFVRSLPVRARTRTRTSADERGGDPPAPGSDSCPPKLRHARSADQSCSMDARSERAP